MSITISRVHGRVMRAFVLADPTPDLITLSVEDWHDMFDNYTPTVKEQYATNGMFWVPRRKARAIQWREPIIDSVQAFTYKGVPVVVREDYERLMDGHSSSRNVLAL
jgi:hypothetical protein